MRFWIIASSLVVFMAATAVAQEGQFEREEVSRRNAHAAEFEQASSLSMAGDIDGAEKLLLGLATADNSAAMCLVVGDALYNTDPAASYKLHKTAYDAQPDERTAVLEWAMERHRKGEYPDAARLYEKFLKLVPADLRTSALLADCLIRQRKLKEAVAAWEAAGYRQNHTAIDFAICDIYGEPAPPKRRGDLLKRIQQGDDTAIERLIDLDLNFNRDWWNGGPNDAALEHDLPLVERRLGKGSRRMAAIRCWVKIKTQAEATVDFVKAQLKQAGLLVAGGALPENSLAASRLLGEVMDRQIEPKDQLRKQFQQELLGRAKSKLGDVEALNILCNLLEPGPQRDELERYGAQRYGDERFVVGLCALLMRRQQLKSDSPELTTALKKFPENNFLSQMVLRLAGKDHLTKEMLAAAIRAEYRMLSPDPLSLVPTSGRLNAYFALLKQRL